MYCTELLVVLSISICNALYFYIVIMLTGRDR